MKGKCVNLDCPEFDKIVDIPDGEDFVCQNPECGHKLHELTDESGGLMEWIKEHKILLGIIVAVLVIGGIVTWFLLAKDAPLVTAPTDIIVE